MVELKERGGCAARAGVAADGDESPDSAEAVNRLLTGLLLRSGSTEIA